MLYKLSMVLSYQEVYVLQTLPFRIHIFFNAGTTLRRHGYSLDDYRN